MNARELTEALGGQWRGSQGLARCPCHDDRTPSLSISERDGKLLVHCHAGCEQEDLWSTLRSQGLVNGQAVDTGGLKPRTHPRLGKPGDIFVYSPEIEIWRWDNPPNSNKKKEIRPLVKLGGEWKWEHPPAPRRLYRLEDLEADSFKPILLVEGEKTVEVARMLFAEYTVMTWPGGVGAIEYINWRPLGNHKVTCWPDNDEEGRSTMLKIADKLTQLGSAVRVVDVPQNLPRKWDLADDIPADIDIDTLILEAPLFERERATLPSRLIIVDAHGITHSPPERPWLIGDWIPRRAVTMLSGDGGLGKSLLGLQLQTCCAAERAWLGEFAMGCASLGIYCEDEIDELHRRQWDINAATQMHTPKGVHWVSRVGEDNALVTFDRFTSEMEPTGLWQDIHDAAMDLGARLVLLDALHDFFPGNENDRVQARRFINLISSLARDIDGAVILMAHPSQAGRASGSGESGSTAWNNAVRSRLYFSRPRQDESELQDPNARILSNRKSNYAASGAAIECRLKNGIFVPKSSRSTSAVAVEQTLLEAIARLTNQGVNMSFSPHASNYAPRDIIKAGLNEGASSQQLSKALRDLEMRGVLGTEKYGKSSNQHTRIAILRKDLFDADQK